MATETDTGNEKSPVYGMPKVKKIKHHESGRQSLTNTSMERLMNKPKPKPKKSKASSKSRKNTHPNVLTDSYEEAPEEESDEEASPREPKPWEIEE